MNAIFERAKDLDSAETLAGFKDLFHVPEDMIDRRRVIRRTEAKRRCGAAA